MNEKQFFDILYKKTTPPALKTPENIGAYISYREERRYNIDFHYKEEEFVIKKRNINLEKYDIYSANIGSYITCIQHLRKLKQVIDYLRQNYLFDYHSKNYAKTCKRCGRYSMFHLRDEDSGFYAPLCKFCYNVMMAKVLAIPVPHKIPNTITVKDFNEISIEFEINLIIFETGISLSALHYGSRKRKIEVFGELETDYIKLLESLKQKVKKRTSTRYIDSSGHFTGDYAIGHIEFDGENNEHIVIINNVPYSWDNLKCNLSSYEGWDIKIEFGEPGDDLD